MPLFSSFFTVREGAFHTEPNRFWRCCGLVDKAVGVFRVSASHRKTSHSLVAVSNGDRPAVTNTIFPLRSISTRFTATPAFTAPFTAFVTSPCLKVVDPLAIRTNDPLPGIMILRASYDLRPEFRTLRNKPHVRRQSTDHFRGTQPREALSPFRMRSVLDELPMRSIATRPISPASRDSELT